MDTQDEQDFGIDSRKAREGRKDREKRPRAPIRNVKVNRMDRRPWAPVPLFEPFVLFVVNPFLSPLIPPLSPNSSFLTTEESK